MAMVNEGNLLTRGKREETREAALDYFRNMSALLCVRSFDRFTCTRNNSEKSLLFCRFLFALLTTAAWTPFRVA